MTTYRTTITVEIDLDEVEQYDYDLYKTQVIPGFNPVTRHQVVREMALDALKRGEEATSMRYVEGGIDIKVARVAGR